MTPTTEPEDKSVGERLLRQNYARAHVLPETEAKPGPEVAGPALDAWICLHVMGWQFRQPMPSLPECFCPPGKPNGMTRPPYYSADIREAWRVVERMRELGYRMTITMGINTSMRSAECVCSFVKTVPEIVVARTAPLSICLAAKRALEARG